MSIIATGRNCRMETPQKCILIIGRLNAPNFNEFLIELTKTTEIAASPMNMQLTRVPRPLVSLSFKRHYKDIVHFISHNVQLIIANPFLIISSGNVCCLKQSFSVTAATSKTTKATSSYSSPSGRNELALVVDMVVMMVLVMFPSFIRYNKDNVRQQTNRTTFWFLCVRAPRLFNA